MSRHYESEELFEMLDAEEPQDLSAVEHHATECPPCARRLREAREILELLRAQMTWDLAAAPPPDVGRGAELTELARRLRDEDRDAEQLLAQLHGQPIATWRDPLRRILSSGVVQALASATHDRIEKDPPGAYELACLTTDLADELDTAAYPGSLVLLLQARAWKERASALRYLGRYPEGLEAVDRADSFLDQTLVGAFERAGTLYVRAYLLTSMHRLDEADGLFEESGRIYASFGEHPKARQSQLMQGMLRYERGDLTGSRDFFLRLLPRVEADLDPHTHARLLSNLGVCFAELGQPDEAGTYLHQALVLYDELDMPTERVRVQWSLGEMLTQTGQLERGLELLRRAQHAFEEFGMTADVGLVGLVIAEALLAANRTLEVQELCEDILKRFTAAGMTRSAITALAYLKEAAKTGTATPAMAKHVKKYLERLPEEPDLLFAPPPVR